MEITNSLLENHDCIYVRVGHNKNRPYNIL